MAKINGPLQSVVWKLRILCEILSVDNVLQTWKLRAKFEDRSDKFNTWTVLNPNTSKLSTKLKWNTSEWYVHSEYIYHQE
jgi:hypothetical protein